MDTQNHSLFRQTDHFTDRHIGPRFQEKSEMLKEIGFSSLEELISKTVPSSIRLKGELDLKPGWSERRTLSEIRALAQKNQIFKSFIGMGYSGTHTPTPILRHVLENPGWYTQYTPYQAEISQGRLEALLNYQTMVSDLTGLPVANASLLDEGTAAAEAMGMAFQIHRRNSKKKFFIHKWVHPQTIEVVKTRAKPLGIELEIGALEDLKDSEAYFGVLVQLSDTRGEVRDYSDLFKRLKKEGGPLCILACDPLLLTKLKSPADMGADIALGSAQRFGVPMGYGGPHAAFFACSDEHKRLAPGRIVGLSKDADGNPAARLALQTREQHIRREKATSNICTAQVLLAIMASFYAVYHGPEGVQRIAMRVHDLTRLLKRALEGLGVSLQSDLFFDTLHFSGVDAEKICSLAESKKINLRKLDENSLTISLDETTTEEDLKDLIQIFEVATGKTLHFEKWVDGALASLSKESSPLSSLFRSDEILKHSVFNRYHSETEFLRYVKRLESKDLSLTTSMIPLGSCTMKLNAATEMEPITWPEFAGLHPFAPVSQAEGYQILFKELERDLAEITGFDGVSLQPNAGAQGEYAGLLVIRAYQEARGESHRTVCLIPTSAHGTNPASAVMAGLDVVSVKCDENGNISLTDLKEKAEKHRANLSAAMITYPSTHGVFEETISEICEIVHKNGGQVYMDGANLNAQVGVCRPGDYGPDVCHLNLHKTFCIPHGGGGPGMGPIAAKKHLVPFMPSHPVVKTGGSQGIGPISAAPWGSSAILPISWSYIKMMGGRGLKEATETAILNANYIAKKLEPYFPVLYKGKNGLVAHECIIDLRELKKTSGVEVEDVAKRLMDYGFHAPTISWPVAGTMMIEPTESESKRELDRFCEAMIEIRSEIAEIENGKADRNHNVLKNAPHPVSRVVSSEWAYPYSREKAAYPVSYLKEHKFWPPVSRIDNVYGDRQFCSCLPM